MQYPDFRVQYIDGTKTAAGEISNCRVEAPNGVRGAGGYFPQ